MQPTGSHSISCTFNSQNWTSFRTPRQVDCAAPLKTRVRVVRMSLLNETTARVCRETPTSAAPRPVDRSWANQIRHARRSRWGRIPSHASSLAKLDFIVRSTRTGLGVTFENIVFGFRSEFFCQPQMSNSTSDERGSASRDQ